ncbi:MAG: hypothetical protein ABEJ89_07585 [Haloarculaceae archaeon]
MANELAIVAITLGATGAVGAILWLLHREVPDAERDERLRSQLGAIREELDVVAADESDRRSRNRRD